MKAREGRAISGDTTKTWGVGEAAAAGVRVRLPSRWRLIRSLGRGGQAEVWLAEDRELGEQVALKIFGTPPSESARERWRQEVRIGRRLQHPNLLRLFDLIEVDGALVAVMEAMPGGTLADRIERGPLDVVDVVGLAEQLLDVLGYLHRQGIVHRDVKPSNILFAGDGAPRLGDLGLVRDLEGGPSLTATLTAVGTPSYMAPEQLRGERPHPSWDLYALGVTLYEALTGRPPFQGSSSFEVADGHLHREAPSPRRLRRDCPVWLSRLIQRLLEKRPERRWPSAEAALAALRRRRVARSPTVRRRLAAAATALLAVAAAGALAVPALLGRGEVASVNLSPTELVALDGSGHELWRDPLEGTGVCAAAGNFLPLRGREVLLLEGHPAENPLDMPVRLLALDGRGRPAGSWQIRPDPYWGVSPEGWCATRLEVADLEGDGLDEAFVPLNHRLWYPSQVMFFGERAGIRGIYPVFRNGGHLEDLEAADLNGDGVRDLLVTGLDNPMGFQAIAAAVDGRLLLQGAGACSPDVAVTLAQTGGSYLDPLLFYTPLGSMMPVGNTAIEISASPSGIQLDGSFGRLELDGDGNPRNSPLFGKGREPRKRFWRDLHALCQDIGNEPAAGMAAWHRFAESHRDLWEERPSRTAAALLVSGSLAGEGVYGAATSILEETATAIPDERDLWLRLGEYRLLAGDRRGGRKAVLRSVAPAGTGRNVYDPFLILGLDAALNVDESGLEEAARLLRRDGAGAQTLSSMGEALRLILFFFEGRWDDPRFGTIAKDPAIPALRWVQRWVELEHGRDPLRVVESVRSAVEAADLPLLGRLVEAEGLRRAGRSDEALQVVDPAARELEQKGRTSFELAVWCPLAEWELGRCLLDLGERAEARRHLEQAARRAPGTWFGQDAGIRLASLG